MTFMKQINSYNGLVRIPIDQTGFETDFGVGGHRVSQEPKAKSPAWYGALSA